MDTELNKKELFVNLQCLYDWQRASNTFSFIVSQCEADRCSYTNLLSCMTHQSGSQLASRSSNQSVSVSSAHPVSSWFSQETSQPAWQRAAEESINKTYCTSEGFRSIELSSSSGHQTTLFFSLSFSQFVFFQTTYFHCITLSLLSVSFYLLILLPCLLFLHHTVYTASLLVCITFIDFFCWILLI